MRWHCILLSAVLILAAAGVDAANPSQRTRIVVGSELDYPPYALVTEDGQADGFSVDLMKAVSEVMEIDVTFWVGPWSEIRAALENGEIDALPLVSYSEAREKVFDFTVPYTMGSGVFFKRKGSPSIESPGELGGKEIVAMRSDATHDWLLRNGISENLVLAKTVPEVLRALAAGKHDYALAPRLVGLLIVNQLGLTNLETTGPLINVHGRGYGFAVTEGNSALLAQFNEGLNIIKATGRYDEIYEKWFGVVDPKGIATAVIVRYVIWGAGGIAVLIGLTLTWIVVLRRAVNLKTAEVRSARDNLELRVEERTKDLQKEITERRQAEEALGEREERYRSVVATAHDGFWVVDMAGRLIEVNDAYVRRSGYSREELLSMSIPDLDVLDAAADVDARIQRILRSGSDLFTSQHRTKSGEVWDVEVGVSYVETEGGLFFSFFRDITERKQSMEALHEAKEQADFANRSKTEFLANMSHELRTPLNSIIGFSEMMIGEVFGPLGEPKYVEYASDIKNGGEHLVKVINDILDISRIEAGEADFQEEEVNVGEAVEACMTMLNERARKAHVKLMAEVADDFPRLLGDETRIKQIILNLLSNSVKFSPAKGKVTVEAKLGDHGEIVLKVGDTGIGIATEDIPKVLEPFAQVEDIMTRSHEGVGLGLPLSQRLTELHGGTLTIESEVGKGTTVTVRFPPERTMAT